MSPQRPAVVTAATWLTAAVVVMSGVSALLTLVFEDELLEAWRDGRADAGSVEQPAFVPVAIVMFVVVALLVAVLMMFFREGHNWARVLIIALIVLLGVSTLAGLRTSPPALFLVLALVSIAVDLAAVGCLLHKDTRAYFSDAPVGSGSHS